jgi:hypothetical protein
MAARYELLQFTRFPGMQPFGNYAIHIVVRNGRTMLVGGVDSESDRLLAGVRAREVPGVFAVDNDLVVRTKSASPPSRGADCVMMSPCDRREATPRIAKEERACGIC